MSMEHVPEHLTVEQTLTPVPVKKRCKRLVSKATKTKYLQKTGYDNQQVVVNEQNTPVTIFPIQNVHVTPAKKTCVTNLEQLTTRNIKH